MTSRSSLALAIFTAVIHPAMLHAAPPERGFWSTTPAAKWEQALVTGNGVHGAMVFGVPEEETVIINHGQLYLPLHKPLAPPDTAAILPEIRSLMAGGEFQKAADRVVEQANRDGYSGKQWTDPEWHVVKRRGGFCPCWVSRGKSLAARSAAGSLWISF